MAGFKKGQFFEIEDFDFGIQAVDTDSAAVAAKPPTGGDPHATDQTKARTGQFAKWIQNKTVSMEGGGYPIEMSPFQFTRQLDIASPLLFQRCFQTKPYNSAALVMRKVGDTAVRREVANRRPAVSAYRFRDDTAHKDRLGRRRGGQGEVHVRLPPSLGEVPAAGFRGL